MKVLVAVLISLGVLVPIALVGMWLFPQFKWGFYILLILGYIGIERLVDRIWEGNKCQ